MKILQKYAVEPLVVISSKHSVKDTMDRLVLLLVRLDMTVYARINRQLGCGLETRPMECILFDDPELSSPVVEKCPAFALCFPMKIIAWDDGGCWVAYNDPVVLLQVYDRAAEGFYWPDLRTCILQEIEK